jgi:hypothetical protein
LLVFSDASRHTLGRLRFRHISRLGGWGGYTTLLAKHSTRISTVEPEGEEEDDQEAEEEDNEGEHEGEKGGDDLQICTFSDSWLVTAVSSSSRQCVTTVVPRSRMARVSSALPLRLSHFLAVVALLSTEFRGAGVFDGRSRSSSSLSTARFDLRDAMDETDDNDHVLGTSPICTDARAVAGDEEEMEVEEEEEEAEEEVAVDMNDAYDNDDMPL